MTLSNAVRVLSASWFSLGLGAGIGMILFAFAPDIGESMRDAYDNANPVVRSHNVKVVKHAQSEVIVEGRFEKLRDCERLGIEAYSRHKHLNTLIRANIESVRAGGPALSHIHPGESLLGTFRVWPVVESSSVLIYVSHNCNGRTVWSKIIEVSLPQG